MATEVNLIIFEGFKAFYLREVVDKLDMLLWIQVKVWQHSTAIIDVDPAFGPVKLLKTSSGTRCDGIWK